MAHGTHRGVCSRSSKPPYAKPESQREQTNALRLLAPSFWIRAKTALNQKLEGRECAPMCYLRQQVRAASQAGNSRARPRRARRCICTHSARTRSCKVRAWQAGRKSNQKRLRSTRRRFKPRDGTGAEESRESAAEAPTARDTRLFAHFVRINGRGKPRARF